ncbi:MAG: hypothetical protein ACR2IF_04905 [Terriglobales bacterium]
MTAAARRKKVNIHLVCGAFFADVVTDSRVNPPIHHWIVQRQGSPEVVHWGQEASLEAAESAASSFMNDLAERENRKKA